MFLNFRKHAARLKKKNIETSEELANRLLEETGVAVLPGSVFGRPKEELTTRIAYVDFDGPKALAAAETLPPHKTPDSDFLNSYCSNMLEASEILCKWLK